MQLYQCMQTHSTCYKGTDRMAVKGILWHSTGANNPNLKRYVQPYETDTNYNEAIAKLGKNTLKNDWNHIQRSAGLNAWIGKFADGTVGTVQTMPWDYKPWGCGKGRNGSCNNGWIQFEICEDNLQNKEYAEKVWKEAIELSAYLCKMYGLNPLSKTKCGSVDVPVITCHNDSAKYGCGCNHADINHWFPKILGKNMDNARKEIADLLNGGTVTPQPEPTITKSNDEIAKEVLAGKWGNGIDRKNRLTAAGYDYNAIQSIVNTIAGAKPSAEATVNYYTVQRGDTASYIAKKSGITLAQLKKLNPSQKNWNLIYPGQRFRIQ